MKYRSNIERYADFVFEPLDPSFPSRALDLKDRGGQGIIVAGVSYGQGSSREHAAICPMHLGVKAVIALSFERIHAANLINFGILPLRFNANSDYEAIEAGDNLHIPDIRTRVASSGTVTIHNRTRGATFQGTLELSEREKEILLAGGALNLAKKQGSTQA